MLTLLRFTRTDEASPDLEDLIDLIREGSPNVRISNSRRGSSVSIDICSDDVWEHHVQEMMVALTTFAKAISACASPPFAVCFDSAVDQLVPFDGPLWADVEFPPDLLLAAGAAGVSLVVTVYPAER